MRVAYSMQLAAQFYTHTHVHTHADLHGHRHKHAAETTRFLYRRHPVCCRSSTDRAFRCCIATGNSWIATDYTNKNAHTGINTSCSFTRILSTWNKLVKKAQLPQRDRATHHVSKFVLFHEVWELERFQTAKVTFKVIQWHWQWCRSIGHIRFSISIPLQPCHHLAPLTG